MRGMMIVGSSIALSLACTSPSLATTERSGTVDLTVTEKPTNPHGKGPSANLNIDLGGGHQLRLELHDGGSGMYYKIPLPERAGGGSFFDRPIQRDKN